MFMNIASRAAESDESYNKAASSAEQLAQDMDKSLKIRNGLDLGNLPLQKVHNILLICLDYCETKANIYLYRVRELTSMLLEFQNTTRGLLNQ
jgi:hypothetical protein